jgi:hypothetical protein
MNNREFGQYVIHDGSVCIYMGVFICEKVTTRKNYCLINQIKRNYITNIINALMVFFGCTSVHMYWSGLEWACLVRD